MIFWAFLIIFLFFFIPMMKNKAIIGLFAQNIEHYSAFLSLPSTLDEILDAVSRLLGSA